MQEKKGIILFVDDEYYMLQTYKAIFRRDFKDYSMLFAQNGDEALKLLSGFKSKDVSKLVVMSDWLMPGIKGDALLVKIHELFPNSIGFLMSGMINQEPEKEIFQKGNIRKVIVKPWDNHELKELLLQTLNE
jgi:response regulator RpfG family c-di-GMP phosphodiesterase